MQNLSLILLLAFIATPAAADSWKNTAESELTFVVEVDGSKLNGTFAEFDVTLATATEGSNLAEFEVTVNLTSADLGDPDTNSVLFNPAWFHTGKYPKAVFKTTNIEEQSTNVYEVTGELDLKGTTKTLHFQVEFTGNKNTASITGTTSINRNDFHVGSGEWASDETVGVAVELTFDVKLNRAH